MRRRTSLSLQPSSALGTIWIAPRKLTLSSKSKQARVFVAYASDLDISKEEMLAMESKIAEISIERTYQVR